MYSIHLKNLGFGEMVIAACCATQATAAVVASLLAGQAGDRWLPPERALAGCAALSGALLWLLPSVTEPSSVFVVTLLFWMACGPMTLMGTTVTFTHLPAPERQFGPVRMWGTVGWAAIGLLVALWQWLGGAVADAFRIGGLIAFALAGYALTLPSTPPRGRASSRFAPLAAMGLLKGETFLVYFLCMFGASLTFPFNTQLLPMLLERLGVPQRNISATLTLCQVTEIATLFVLPAILLALGLRRTMLLGLSAWCLAFLASSAGSPAWLILGSLTMHGLYITGFMIAGQVYVNGVAEGDMRASVQGLFNCVSGLGLLLGNLLAGWLRRVTGDDLPLVFTAAATVNVLMLVLFAVRFRYRPGEEAVQ